MRENPLNGCGLRNPIREMLLPGRPHPLPPVGENPEQSYNRNDAIVAEYAAALTLFSIDQ
jgi:hypothetical protein